MIKLFTPGPVQVSSNVLNALSEKTVYHRSDDFRSIYKSLKNNLRNIFFCDLEPVVLTSSGTGAMDAIASNLCDSSDKVLNLVNGRFGERWVEILKFMNISCDAIKLKPGEAFKIKDLESTNLDEYTHIFITHCETSTGTVSDLKTLINYIKTKTDALIVVDAVTSIAAIEFRFDDWKIDAAISASQKGLQSPPGLSVIALSEKALNKLNQNKTTNYYFDLKKEFKASSNNNTSFTPSVNLFQALYRSSELILEKGLESIWEDTFNKAELFRVQSQLTGFELFSSSPSDSVTALIMPGNVPSSLLINKLLEEKGFLIANGQIDLKDKIIRVSHMGDLSLNDFDTLSESISEIIKRIND